MKVRVSTWSSALLVALWASSAGAATLKVGSAQKYKTIQDAMAMVKPGDIVEVDGDQTFTGTITFRPEQGGTADAPVTVRGVPVNGHRPVLMGVGPGMWDNMVVLLNANHFVFESFEIVGDGGDSNDCIFHKADDVVLRDLVVHECTHQAGLVGGDSESGSLTLEYSEFYNNGSGESSHQIYMATDQETYPGSVFRMQYCYVHDGLGGNNVKSRSERNEIYYNWIEGAMYHELDLIGPDTGVDPAFAREDSDVVGNILIKSSEWRIARIGGDGSGNTSGRYRFVNNTMVLSATSKSVIGLQETVESLEMYNNVIHGPASGYKIYEIDEQSGPMTTFAGSNNWVPDGTQSIPTEWTMTITGKSPGWVDQAGYDFRPAKGSPLIDQATMTTAATGSIAFPSPLAAPAFMPPEHVLLAPGTGEARKAEGALDIGAFEQNAAAPGPPPTKPEPLVHGCGCRMAGDPGDTAGWLGTALAACLLGARRRRPRS
jgi:MYXO-CTERM domain-containing protein